MSKSIVLMATASLFCGAVVAQTAPASTPTPAPAPVEPFAPLSANVSLTSNYKFRGQDQGNNKPAIQGGFDITKWGFYLGNWNSSIDIPNAHIEIDFYGGYRGEITKDIAYDIGVLQYFYPQGNRVDNGAADYNTTEVYGSLAYGPAKIKYSHTVSRDYFGFGSIGSQRIYNGRNTGYLEVAADIPIPVVPELTVNTHLGYTNFSSGLSDGVGVPNYFDYKAGVTYDLSRWVGSGVTLAGAVVGANKASFFGDINKVRFIATLSKAI